MAARKLVALLAAVLQLCICQITPEVLPEFLAPLENHTVVQGRNVFFTCVVNHLQSYRVAWIKSDSRAILAIQTHLIAHNPRLSVTHNGHNTWKLHVSDVQKNDSGTYMCQVNTDPMRSQMGYMDVVIPPNIVDDDSSNGLTHEGGSVTLKCTATGSPEPNVTWKREDGRNIILRVGDRKTSVPKYEGEVLELNGVLRQEMGQYLCIASNNVPPTVSKRYFVQVNFPPLIKVPNHVLTTPLKTDVVLQCLVEASPHALNTWYRNSETGKKLLPGDKYEMSEYPLNDYTWQMNLTVKSFELRDSGGYVCSSVNSLGKADAVVRLQVRHLTVETTPAPLSRNIDTRPRKVLKDKKKELRGSGRKSHGSSRVENANSIDGDDDLGTTQIMAGSTQHENQRTDRPLALPSLSPPWVIANAASVRQCSAILLLLISPATIAF